VRPCGKRVERVAAAPRFSHKSSVVEFPFGWVVPRGSYGNALGDRVNVGAVVSVIAFEAGSSAVAGPFLFIFDPIRNGFDALHDGPGLGDPADRTC